MEPTPAKPSSAATVEGSSRVVIFPPAEGREGFVDDARRHPTTNDAARRGGLAVPGSGKKRVCGRNGKLAGTRRMATGAITNLVASGLSRGDGAQRR